MNAQFTGKTKKQAHGYEHDFPAKQVERQVHAHPMSNGGERGSAQQEVQDDDVVPPWPSLLWRCRCY